MGLTKPSVEAQKADSSRSGEGTDRSVVDIDHSVVDADHSAVDVDHSAVDVDHSVEETGRCSVEAEGPEIVAVYCASADWA